MEITRILRTLWKRKGWLALGLLPVAVLTILLSYRVSLSPFEVSARTLAYGSASTQVLVDTQRSSLASATALTDTLGTRAAIVAQFMQSQDVRAALARELGVQGVSVSEGSAPVAGGAVAPGGGSSGYSVTYVVEQGSPLINLSTRAPSGGEATKLADASAAALATQVQRLGDETGVSERSPSRVVVRQIGPAIGGTISSSVDRVALLLTFFALMVIWSGILVLVPWFAADWRRAAAEEQSLAQPQEPAPLN